MSCTFLPPRPSTYLLSSRPLTPLLGLIDLPAATTFRRFFCGSNRMTSPLHPKFKSVDDVKSTDDSNTDGFKLRIVSYNILAQVFVKSSYFPHSPSSCLKWKARSQAILTVLKGLKSDFLCIQELDEYDSFYKKRIETNGYSSIYIQRSGQKRDGCGIFYKQNFAELLLNEKIEYNDLVPSAQDEKDFSSVSTPSDAQITETGDVSILEDKGSAKKDPGDRGDPNDPRVRLKRDCVGIMGAFKLKDPSQHIVIVANTHLYWDPEWADVKLAQAEYLLLRLSRFKDTVSKRFGCAPSVIVCGDFNSIPGDKVYQYLVSGSSSSAVPPVDDVSENLPIPLCSVYAVTVGEPAFTNCTPGFTNTLDYIFFCPSGQLKPVAVLELPGPESSDVAGGLPNFLHPSDHLPIGAEFKHVSKVAYKLDLPPQMSGFHPIFHIFMLWKHMVDENKRVELDVASVMVRVDTSYEVEQPVCLLEARKTFHQSYPDCESALECFR